MIATIRWTKVHPAFQWPMLGYLPSMLNPEDPRPAREQINTGYVFGGWRPLSGCTIDGFDRLCYPGDPPQPLLAKAQLHTDEILYYPHDFVAIRSPDGKVEVGRLD